MFVFLDANVFLSFYRLSKDDLVQLEKLVDAASIGRVILLCDTHLKDEVLRNRDSELSRSLLDFSKQKVEVKIPSFARQYKLYSDMKEMQKQLNHCIKSFYDEVRSAARDGNLLADDLIRRFFQLASTAVISDSDIALATDRGKLGNPPGKLSSGSIGDALHWQVLLRRAKFGGQFALVTGDSDFYSALDQNNLHPFLEREWREMASNAHLTLHSSLTDFLSFHFPEIKLNSELSVGELVDALKVCPSERAAIEIVESLMRIGGLTSLDVRSVLDAFYENPEVANVTKQEIVADFLIDLFEIFKGTSLGQELFDLVDGGFDLH